MNSAKNELSSISRIKKLLENNFTGKYCIKHPECKIYKCTEPTHVCSEKYSIGPDRNHNPIFEYRCDLRDFCNNRMRCAECDREHLEKKVIDYQNWWQSCGRGDAKNRFFEKRKKEKASKFERNSGETKENDYKSKQYKD